MSYVNLIGLILMIFIMIPNIIYLCVDFILVFVYWIIWIFWFKKNNFFRAVALSLLPFFVFLFSGLLSRYFILSIFALIFGICHVPISVKLCDDFDFSNYGKRY